MIKAILFDVDGVLVDSKKSNIAVFQNILTKAGYPKPSAEEVMSCFHMPLWQSLEKLTGVADQAEIKRIWSLASDRSVRAPELFEFPRKFEETLEALHKKYKLAIVTSRIQSGVDDIFDVREIKHLFDVVVAFEDYAKPKPHPEPLLLALDKLGVGPEEAVYVGDTYVDVEAAQAACMPSIHLAPQKHDDATVGINHFEELVTTIESLDLPGISKSKYTVGE